MQEQTILSLIDALQTSITTLEEHLRTFHNKLDHFETQVNTEFVYIKGQLDALRKGQPAQVDNWNDDHFNYDL